MRDSVARLILVGFDILAIYVSIVVAYYLRVYLGMCFELQDVGSLSHYTRQYITYVIIIMTLFGLHVYKYRHDFWEETYLVFKSLVIALVLISALLVFSKTSEHYSRILVATSFIIMAIIISFWKYILKKKLFVFGFWGKRACVISGNSEISKEIFENKYLGYIKGTSASCDVVFMDTAGHAQTYIESTLASFVRRKKQVIFIPIMNSFNYSHAGIIEIFNARTNMIVLENSLLKHLNIWTKLLAETFLALLLLPLMVPLFAIIIYLMKKEEPNGSVFFKQERMGQDGKIFGCYKFRSMREDGDAILQSYLQEHPEEVENYNIYHKYEHDPRITKIGRVLRKTSLDEIPQIINVLKGEMALIGPRPYMLSEKEKIGSNIDMILAVKPGITGLWQVSGRSDVDFASRVDMDVYYTRNWTLWMDFVIFIKTIKVVLFRDGAS